MAENKKSFLIYCDIIHSIDHLTNEEKGVLFQHLLEYVNDMNPVLEDRLLITAWKPIERQLKRDLVKWEQKQEQRVLAGKRSAELRKRNSTTVDERQQASTVNGNVNGNVNVITTIEENAVDFDLIDKWVNDLPSQQIWLEGIYRLNKLQKGSVSRIAAKFKEHLKVYPTKHLTFDDFKSHLANWIRTQANNNQLNEYITKRQGSL